MRRCWWNCWKALKLFETIETAKKYDGKAMFINAGCWWNCWKELKPLKTIANTKNYYGKTGFINAEMLVELLESIETLQNH